MDKSTQVIMIAGAAILIRFLITGGFSEVLALLVIAAAYFTNKFLTKKPLEVTELKSLEEDVDELKTQVSNLSIAQGMKSAFGKSNKS